MVWSVSNCSAALITIWIASADCTGSSQPAWPTVCDPAKVVADLAIARPVYAETEAVRLPSRPVVGLHRGGRLITTWRPIR